MTESVGKMLVAAAAPEAINAIQALETFVSSMGTDPSKWVVNYPGAKLILLGSLLQQVPQLEVAEVSALDAAINSGLSSLVTKLKAKEMPAS